MDEETLEAKRKEKQKKRHEKVGKVPTKNTRKRRSNI
jgi:hypothetical protein